MHMIAEGEVNGMIQRTHRAQLV